MNELQMLTSDMNTSLSSSYTEYCRPFFFVKISKREKRGKKY